MTPLRLTPSDVAFLLDSLKWAQVAYEERSAKYLYGVAPNFKPVGEYRENQYLPTMKMFEAVSKKLRSAK